ncbi:acyl-homoserine-lactone acylase [Nocardioides albertanoniae]|uniref:Acyl-homoserine-lactone acylase n=1 Tax=Nocardioides albertanoniae TaxID=1175486 RepID=A0A543A9Z5_9ACTN|nr:penicillin acylase family protein [Nocardioides albertanoniae]TQL69330.1 acyl-homoserine-lactone acylase [Nocardioides albertanoniae]
MDSLVRRATRSLAPLVLLGGVLSAPAAVADPGPPAYDATVRITEHGIPHITAGDWGSLGYGSGWATAGEATCTLADILLSARGERSRWLGAEKTYDDRVSKTTTNLDSDVLVGDLHNRQVVEKLLDSPAGPSARAREMVRGYAAGVNEWLRTHEITDPACADAPYIKPDATETDVWYGVYLANLIASAGQFVSEINQASPPSLTDPGLPDLPGALGLPSLPTTAAEVPAAAAKVDKQALLASLGRDPESDFGSNATAIGGESSSTGRGMLLGNPHFPWQGRYRFTQQHLTIPGEYDVAGASLIGSPAVNIGWNDDVAWSHTVSTAYRFTPYEYTTLGPGTRYLTPDGVRKAERREVEVEVKTASGTSTVTEDLYRTPEGYVVDSPSQLMAWGPQSFWAIRDANAEHLRTIDTFLGMGGASSAGDLLERQDAGGGVPWVNTIAADRHGDALYADHSVVPHVTDQLASRCMTVVGRLLDTVAGLPGLDGNRAGHSCAWGSDEAAQRPGIFGPEHLPDVQRRDWVMNANDSHWLPNPKARLEGYPAIIGCERCERTMRTQMVAGYVTDQLAAHGVETPDSLAGHEYDNRQRAAEVMKADGALDRVCRFTGEKEACGVLARWDGRSDATSVGTAIFTEFVQRAPSGLQLWRVPFDADDPLNTPRGLRTTPSTIKAMKDAIAAVEATGLPIDSPWGDYQVAGDRGAPPLPLGGGNGDLAGNANALASRNPAQNLDHARPITYGSSHIQAVSFGPHGAEPRTILTYGQHENPASPWSSDQTRLFSEEKWVDFPWTDAQIRADLVETVRLH